MRPGRTESPGPRRRGRGAATLALAGLVAAAAGVGTTGAAFSATAASEANTYSAATDFLPPEVSRAAIAKVSGYYAGYIRQAGTFYVYAQVTDGGSPPSGTASVTADVASVSTGGTAVALVAGSYTAEGVTYNYRSAARTAKNPLAAGAAAFTVTTTDNAANTRTFTGFSVTVDNTKPAGSSIQTANGGATPGRPETGDTVTRAYSEPVDPQSILAGWTGAATNVVVRLNNGGTGNDTLLVYNAANTAALPLGSVNLGRTDYVTTSRTFGATGTRSTMAMTGGTITVTLGTASGAVTTAAGTGTMTWTPSATAYDRAGNTATTTAVTESGGADVEF